MATNTIGTGGDFSTAQAWEDDIPVTLTEQRIGQVLNEELNVGGRVLDFSAHTTTPSFNIIFEAAAGAAFNDNINVRTNALRYNVFNGACLRNSSTGDQTIKCDDVEYTVIRNLQLIKSGANLYPTLQMNSSLGTTVAENLIIDGTTDDDSRGVFLGGGNTVENCLIIQRGSGAGSGVVNNTSVSNSFVGCTIVRPTNRTPSGTGGIRGYASENYTDCVFAGFTADVAGPGSITGDYNATTLSDGASGLPDSPDHNVYSLTYDTTLFVQPDSSAGLDFRAVAASAIDGAGVADAAIPTDISLFTRADPPTIGAWEIATALPPALTNITPGSGAQGAVVAVTLTGTNFVVGSTTINITPAGITPSGINVTSATSLTATFTISVVAPVGSYSVTVTTPDGTSNSVSFDVTASASALPNDKQFVGEIQQLGPGAILDASMGVN